VQTTRSTPGRAGWCRATAPVCVTFAAIALIAGCGDDHPATPAATSVTTTSTTATSSTTGTTEVSTTAGPSTTTVGTTTVPPSTVTSFSEPDRGKTFSAGKGAVLTVVLHSTYWRFTTPASSVVEPDGEASVAPDLTGCVPGGGCGTVTMRYRVVGTGTVTLTAHRDSCGEAMGCTNGQGDWQITITVAR
jgi:hypothetical protein